MEDSWGTSLKLSTMLVTKATSNRPGELAALQVELALSKSSHVGCGRLTTARTLMHTWIVREESSRSNPTVVEFIDRGHYVQVADPKGPVLVAVVRPAGHQPRTENAPDDTPTDNLLPSLDTESCTHD
jgi:hypothetical protein